MNYPQIVDIYVNHWTQIRRCDLKAVVLPFFSDEDGIFAQNPGLPLGSRVFQFTLLSPEEIQKFFSNKFSFTDKVFPIGKNDITEKYNLFYKGGVVFSRERDLSKESIVSCNDIFSEDKFIWSNSLKNFLLFEVLYDITLFKVHENDAALLGDEFALNRELRILENYMMKIDFEFWKDDANPWPKIIEDIKYEPVRVRVEKDNPIEEEYLVDEDILEQRSTNFSLQAQGPGNCAALARTSPLGWKNPTHRTPGNSVGL